jgi:hypothetical protein
MLFSEMAEECQDGDTLENRGSNRPWHVVDGNNFGFRSADGEIEGISKQRDEAVIVARQLAYARRAAFAQAESSA